ncbi:hypothetical protein DFS33DRAFT_1082639 [Desarmillaria ectypa]|nr:hypothetical protein DFS33DRAFT_1082639 [Desarmillaria ectypa]
MMAGEPSNVLITIFIVMHTFGWIGSSLTLLTVLCSSRVSRRLTWFNLNFSWIVACLTFSLLFITGQLGKSNPDAGVCLAQASAVSAAPTLWVHTYDMYSWTRGYVLSLGQPELHCPLSFFYFLS